MKIAPRAQLPLAIAAVFLSGCFETPVQERLEIRFTADESVSVRAEVVFAEDVREAAVKERLGNLRLQYADLRDPWTSRFERLDAKHETLLSERVHGELVRVERVARINPDRLGDLFFDTPVTVSYIVRDGVSELALFAGASQRATRAQEQEYKDAVDEFSHDITDYLRAMDRVYDYLELNPTRALTVFETLVGDNGPTEQLTDEEQVLLDAVSDTTDRVLSVLSTSRERAYSLDEISALVNDPFPASIVVVPNGRILEIEGFERDETSEGVRLPRMSLWSAFDSLRGRWLSPDPLVALVENAQSESPTPLSPEELAREPRRSLPPGDWRDVRAELTGKLAVASTFRVTWIARGDANQGADGRPR